MKGSNAPQLQKHIQDIRAITMPNRTTVQDSEPGARINSCSEDRQHARPPSATLLVITAILLLSYSFTSEAAAAPAASPTSTSSSCSSLLSTVDAALSVIPFNASSLRCVAGLSFQDYAVLYGQSAPGIWRFVVSSSTRDAYVGIGFSPTGRMVGSSAVVGWVWSNGTAVAKQYELRGQRPDQCLPDRGELALVDGTTRLLSLGTNSSSSRLYMVFQLNTTRGGGGTPRTRIIYSVGPVGRIPSDSDFLLTEHREARSTIIDYAAGTSINVDFKETLKTVHGVLATFAWGILAPLGIMAARYAKRWDPSWYYTHISVQSLTFALTVAIIITGFKYQNQSLSSVHTHKAFGIFVLSLSVLQVMAYILRPDKSSKIRKYWNLYHHNVGRLAFCFAVGNMFYGFHLGKAVTAWRIAIAVYLGIVVFVAFVFESLKWWRK